MGTRRRAFYTQFKLGLGLALGLTGVALASASCYSTGDGKPPPLKQFYYPVALQVSQGGTVLYAINSDFDLQYNGGTLQSYDLRLIRRHALDLIANPVSPSVPFEDPPDPAIQAGCPANPPVARVDGSGRRQALGETCAPPARASFYARDSVIIGALATDLVLSPPPAALSSNESGPLPAAGNRRFDRLFAPVRGTASLTWVSVERDTFDSVAPADPAAAYGPFRLRCGQSDGRCDRLHMAGGDPNEPGNTRRISMPGEPFGMAMSEDGEHIVVTHQTETKSSLFSTGLSRTQNDAPGSGDDVAPPPALQFVVEQMPLGGIGVAAIPHDRDAFLGASLPRPAFLQTSRALPQLTLLRLYRDELGGVSSSLQRPFLDRERSVPIAISASGVDSRGVAIDPTPRLACKARVGPVDASKGRTQAIVDRELVACARKPARVFIANRSPAALLVGDVGETAVDSSYDPDRVTIHTSVPLANGPSRVYLAPVVDRDGAYALRVFVVCFDSATIYVYDPEAAQLENVLPVAPGPSAMAFDPFSWADVATHKQVPIDPRDADRGLRRYRFAYVASFTNSYVQLVDLDNAQASGATYEKIVFSLGKPLAPKGS